MNLKWKFIYLGRRPSPSPLLSPDVVADLKLSNSPVLTLGDRHIKRVYYKKSLDMIFDEQLKWDKHNDAQCKKISKNIAIFKRARLFVPRNKYVQ